MKPRALVLTVSDRAARGERADESGPLLAAMLERLGFQVAGPEVLPDDEERVAAAVRSAADGGVADLVVLTGGTGVGPRDRTPEAVRAVCDREVPGIGEALRAAGRRRTPLADLARSVAGLRGRTLVVALPGSPRAVAEAEEVLAPLLGHALHVLGGGDHAGPAHGAAGDLPVVAFVGPSGAGKTTLLQRLVRLLAARGWRVGVVKHHHGEADAPGKDTWQHRAAGASPVLLAAADGFALFGGGRPSPEEAVAELAAHGEVDLVLAEGFKDSPFPKVVVLPEVEPADAEAILAAGGPGAVAAVTASPAQLARALGIPCFHRDDVEAVAAFVEGLAAGWRGMPRLPGREEPKFGSGVLVCPGAVVAGRVSVGDRSSIWYNAVVRGDLAEVVVGRETNIQDGAVIHVDEGLPCLIGDRVTVGHRAVVHGCTVGDRSLIGMGAVVLSGARVGEGSLVAAGAVVLEGQEIPPGSLAAGVPARVIRPLREEEAERLARSAASYVRLAERYLARGRAAERHGTCLELAPHLATRGPGSPGRNCQV